VPYAHRANCKVAKITEDIARARSGKKKVPVWSKDRGAERVGYGEGYPPPNTLGGLGERRELPQRGPGQSPAENDFDAF